MRILIVSWASSRLNANGVSLIAQQHHQFLYELGHTVAIVYPSKDSFEMLHWSDDVFFINARGNGSFFKKIFFDKKAAHSLLKTFNPDLVFCESWQNCLTEKFITLCYEMNIKVVVISHGISLHPFTFKLKDLARSFGWLGYWIKFKSLIKKVDAITSLSEISKSNRFYDLQVARSINKTIFPLVNTAINSNQKKVPYDRRNRNILIVGYFSEVKNQLKALKIASKLSMGDFNFIFIGEKTGDYFLKCIDFVNKEKISNVRFLTDKNCSIAEEISNCYLVMSTSTTEVLPVTLLEAMSSGTPFLATGVGAVGELGGGIICDDIQDFVNSINSLSQSSEQWDSLSKSALEAYQKNYTPFIVKSQLDFIVKSFE
jgi:glycosyltransferase involved in cell wall biosynthesis